MQPIARKMKQLTELRSCSMMNHTTEVERDRNDEDGMYIEHQATNLHRTEESTTREEEGRTGLPERAWDAGHLA